MNRVRVIPELRNYHVDSIDVVAPAETYYFEKKYDLEASENTPIEKVTFSGLLRRLSAHGSGTLEIWEPLWVRLLPKHFLAVAAWKGPLPWRWASRRVVSYAMENNDIPMLIAGNARCPRIVSSVFSALIGAYIRWAYSRIAYASLGSQEIYHRLPFVRRVENRVIDNLPARPTETQGRPADSNQRVVFLARMEPRKGTGVVIDAWPSVEESNPSAELIVIGDGPDADSMKKWADEKPTSRTFLGGLDHSEAMRQLAESTVLLLPSIRWGRWREQIGLPIHEGLLNGLTVVTSDETGLADWLSSHGHHVVHEPDASSAAITKSLGAPLDRAQVIDSLPEREGRVEANWWMNDYRGASHGE